MTKHQSYRNYRDFHETLQDMLKILKRKYPNPATSGNLIKEGHFNGDKIDNMSKYAEDNGLVVISSKKYRTREVKIYLITDKGLRLTKIWNKYITELRALGLEHLILSEVK